MQRKGAVIKRHVMKARSLKERERGGVGKGQRERERERERGERKRERERPALVTLVAQLR